MEKNHIVESYENTREEDRLSTNNARRIEFLTTARVLDEWITGRKKILDCAAGTGVYAFYLADKGHEVTATDLTPRHIEVIKNNASRKHLPVQSMVLDATDMSVFGDGSFDVVLNMGPFYHLIRESDRVRCFQESLRVLKKGGLLFTSYIPRYSVFQYVVMQNDDFINADLARQLIETGVLRHEDEKCFWTDTYYSTAEEMEALYRDDGMAVVDHFAQDGVTPLFAHKADGWNDEQFRIWCDYHYSICRQKSLLGASNHVVIVGRK